MLCVYVCVCVIIDIFCCTEQEPYHTLFCSIKQVSIEEGGGCYHLPCAAIAMHMYCSYCSMTIAIQACLQYMAS